jgi:hypothetical protein
MCGGKPRHDLLTLWVIYGWVRRILHLPVERAKRIELTLNLKTAKALGNADRVTGAGRRGDRIAGAHVRIG